jgi:3-methyladenine DNA glycosylase AlkD
MHPMTAEIIKELETLGNSKKAAGMQAYMKTTQPFYGVQAGPRRKSFKAIAKSYKKLTREEYEQIIFELWNGSHRETMYQALEVAEHYKKYRDLQSWPIYDRLVQTATHWDTLDWIVGKLVSPLVLQHREMEKELIKWSQSDNFWVRRASLLAHLHHKEDTHAELLAKTILALAHEEEFFIRKAIGWILRDYSYANPEWVTAFVDAHREKLSNLSKREALKQVNRTRRTRNGDKH